MKENRFTNYVGRNMETSFRFSAKSLAVLFALLMFGLVGTSNPNYPFPQNYQYPHGQIYTGSDVESSIQSLYNSWLSNYYEEGLMPDGTLAARIKFVQPGEDGSAAVSEGIVYGMLITVYMDNATNNTQDKFRRLWNFYKANSDQDGVMNWKVLNFTGQPLPGAGNSHGATDAELDAAQALLMAYKQWDDVYYLNEAKTLISTIWQKETFMYDGKRYLKPGNMFQDYLNPCYFITNAMQLFENPDINPGSYNWSDLINNSYDITQLTRHSSTGLVPDWIYPNGTLLNGIINDKFESYFLYDAIRMPWRMAHAYAWYGHEKAQDIAAKMTDWAITALSGNPANAVDGYLLNGQPFNNPDGHPGFSALGQHHNPCFTGGIGIGAMVKTTPAYTQFLDRAWAETKKVDVHGHYYTHTTQLLYLLTMTGNMPNFWDMLPVFESAETNANGTQVIVDFTKDITSTSAAGSASSWTISTYENDVDVTPTNISVSSVSRDPSNFNRLILTLSAEIAEPFIFVTHTGGVLRAQEDNALAEGFDEKPVANRITNLEPFTVARYTDVFGTSVNISWTREIDPTTLNAGDFTVKVGGVTIPIEGIALDATDPTTTVISIEGGNISSNSNVVTVSYAGGTITGVGSNRTAGAFTDYPVINYYLSVSCDVIADFEDGDRIGFHSWATLNIVNDPDDATNKVLYYQADPTDQYSKIGQIGDGIDPIVADELTSYMRNNETIKLRYRYLSNGALRKDIRIVIHEVEEWWPNGGTGAQIKFNITPEGENEWFEYEYILQGQVSSSATYKWFSIETSDGEANGEELYLDDIRFCPADPSVSFLNARTSYDGNQVEVRFNIGMRVPTDLSVFTVRVGTANIPVTGISSKPGDPAVLVLDLETPIASETDVVRISGGGDGLKSIDNRSANIFTLQPVVNLYNVSVTTGWRDDFESLTDYVTENIGGSATYTFEETTDETFKVTIGGGDTWAHSMNIVTYGTAANASKQVMDLTGREVVSFRYRVPEANTTPLLLRIDFKDRINGRVSDNMGWVNLPISTTWQEMTIDVSTFFLKVYGAGAGSVDRSNITEAQFKIVSSGGTEAGEYLDPIIFDGVIEFDYISIGSALLLTNVPNSVNENEPISATSNANGRIYLVPGGTAPMLNALQEAVLDGLGVVIDCEADVPVSIATTTLSAGYYEAYAYDPVSGGISAKVTVDIRDITPPVIVSCTDGDLPPTASIAVEINEDAEVFIVPVGTTPTLGNLLIANVGRIEVEGGVESLLSLSGTTPGDTYVVYAIDYAYPTRLISDVWINEITITLPPLSISSFSSGTISQGIEDITATLNRDATLYLIPRTSSPTSAADLVSMSVASVEAVGGEAAVILSADVPEGNYYLYAADVDGNMAGPTLPMITVESSYTALENLAVANTSVSVNENGTTTVSISFSPSNATNKDLIITSSADGIATAEVTTEGTATEPAVITISGESRGTATLTIEGADGVSLELTVIVGCNKPAPVVTTYLPICEGDDFEGFTATAAGTLRWYNAAGLAFEGDTFIPTLSVGLNEFTVSNFDVCESETSTVSITVNESPAAEFTDIIGDLCSSSEVIDLTSYASAGVSFSGDGVTGSVLNPADLTEGEYTVNITATNSTTGCTATNSQTGNAYSTPAILTEVQAPSIVVIIGETAPDFVVNVSNNYTTEWYNADGTVLEETGNTFAHGHTSGGPYTYKVRQVNNGCAGEFRTVTLTFSNCDIAPPTIVNVEACEGDTQIDDLRRNVFDVLYSVTWFSDLALTDTVATGDTFTHGHTSGTHTYYATQTGHCTSEPSIATVTINPLPTITWSAQFPTMCDNGDIVNLSEFVEPTSSVITGTGVTNGMFNPSLATGSVTFTADYTNTTTGCSNSAEKTVSIFEAPVVSFIAPEPMCANGSSINLNSADYVDPVGGTFDFGTLAMTGSNFRPSVAEIGANTVIYSYENTQGCIGTASADIIVNELPQVTFDDVNDVCATGGNIDLSQYVTPANGTFTGVGVIGTEFNPESGDQTISYSYTENGCTGTAIASVDVISTPQPDAENASNTDVLTATGSNIQWYASETSTTALATGSTFTHGSTVSATFYVTQTVNGCESTRKAVSVTISDCDDASPEATPNYSCLGSVATSLSAIGTDLVWYSDVNLTTEVGTGVTYTPTITEVGTYTFYVTQNINCQSAPTPVTYEVKALPSVIFTTPSSVCENETDVNLTSYVNPQGGVFSGTGITANGIFNPTSSNDVIATYEYTDALGCTNSISETIVVNATPSITVSTIPSVCKTGGNISLVEYVSPTGGTFSGTAVNAQGTFNVSTAMVGENSLIYTVEDAQSCVGSQSFVVEVTETPQPIANPVTSTTTITQLEATGSFIKWYSDANRTSLIREGSPFAYNVTETTTFYVTQTIDGCESSPRSVTYTITDCEIPAPTVTGITDYCVGDNITLTASGTETRFEWYKNPQLTGAPVAINANYSPSSASSGSVNLYVVQKGSCTSPAAAVEFTINPKPTVTFSQVPTIDLNVSTASIDLNQYVSPTGGVFTSSTADITGSILNPNTSASSNIVTYTVENAYGCSASANRTISITGVSETPVESVNFTQASIAMEDAGPNSTFDISQILDIQPANATINSITYRVSEDNLLEIDENGIATALPISTGDYRNVTLYVDVTTANGIIVSEEIKVNITLGQDVITSITIPTEANINIGGAPLTLSKTVLPLTAADNSITWSIVQNVPVLIDPATGAISLMSTATAGTTFEVIATAQDGSGVVSNSCLVTIVNVIAVESITATISDASLSVGETADINVIFTPANTTQTGLTYTVNVDGQSVVSVDNVTGVVSAIGPGIATITVRSTGNTSLVRTINVTVVQLVTSLSLSAESTTVALNQTLEIVADVQPENADNTSLTWESSNETVATVSSAGVVTGVSVGSAVITATTTDGSDISSSINIEVEKVEVESITLESAASVTLLSGATYQVEFNIAPANASVQDVVYSTDVDGIVSISGNTITAIGSGTVIVTVASADNPSVFTTISITVTVDKTELINLLNIAMEAMRSSTTIMNQLSSTYSIANTVGGDKNATQAEVDAAVTTLRNKLNELGIVTDIDKVVAKNAIVYPIPFDTYIVVKIDNIESIEITDMSGKVVASEQFDRVSEATISTSHLIVNNYNVNVVADGIKYTVKANKK